MMVGKSRLLHAAAGLLLWSFAHGSAESAPGSVILSEIHYHPPAGDELTELVELRNLAAEPVSLSGWTLDGGISYAFPAGAVLFPGEYAVVAREPAAVEAAYDLSGVLGPFTGRLANDGERVALRDAAGGLVDRIDYRDADPWPEKPDGLGPSLERTGLELGGEDQASWRASIFLGGTPGRRNSTDVQRTTRTLIAAGATWRYRKGTAAPSSPTGAWTGPGFNDASWASGPSGFGYGDGDDATLLSDMRGSYTTVYLRKQVTLPDPQSIESLVLSIAYDDAYVAYLNGSEVARSASAGGTPGTPLAFNAVAADLHDGDDAPDSIELKGFASLLHAGDNDIAIQALNESADSSDLSLIPTLISVEIAGSSPLEPAHDVEINEVHAGASAADSFVELFNDGPTSVDISGWKLVDSSTGAGGRVFPAGTVLASGAFLVVPGTALPFPVPGSAGWLGLVTPDLRFVDGLEVRSRPAGRSFGRFPDGDGDRFVLDAPTAGSANLLTLERSLVIDEIQYHPPTGFETAEYIELQNRGAQPLSLAGWRLDEAVRFTFPAVTVPAGGFVVVSGNPSLVQTRHAIAGVLGPWTGRLANDADKIELKDALGNRVDVVHYADDGTWPASTAAVGPDGHGPSVELVHPAMESNHGAAWIASTGTGTPGAANSRTQADPPPIIRNVVHAPGVPRSSEAVLVTARVADERAVTAVRLLSRVDGAGSFTQAAMADDGAHGDGAAGDGRFGATLPPRAAGTIVQFYIEAVDDTGHTRRFPAEAPARACLYQVDDRIYPFELPLYRAVIRAADLAELNSRSVDSDVLLDGTFVRGKDVFYQVGVRYRGDNSRTEPFKSMRIQLWHDQPFEGITNLNLNAVDNHLACFATDFLRRADVPVFATRPVAFSLNGEWQAEHGGRYLRVEAVDNEFLARVFPGDDDGNLYRGRDPSGDGEADLRYLGPDPASYAPFYEKRTNQEAGDYADLIELTRLLAQTPGDDFRTVMEATIDVDEWMRFLAAETALNNIDGAIATDAGEDYYLYRPPSTGRWVLIPWDQNENFQEPTAGILRMGIAAVRRVALEPAFLRLYFFHLLAMLDGPFGEGSMGARLDAAGGLFSEAELASIAQFVGVRQSTVRGLLPESLTAGVEPFYLARTGDPWRFFRGRSEPSGGTAAWAGVAFNDDAWESGPGGFGYGDGDDRTALDDMEDGYTTVYARRAFELPSPAAVTALTLSVRFDDGFVCYLNGTEVARRDVTGTVRFDSEADRDHEAGSPTVIDLTGSRNLLRAGKNVLAAVGINSSAASSDLTLDPELFGPPPGSGCGGRLFAAGPTLAVGGTAPILTTAAVTVGGAPAAFDPVTGRWHASVAVPAGTSTLLVVARDGQGATIESRELEVVQDATSTQVSGAVATTRWTLGASPYRITGDLTIATGATLAIDAGVACLVDPGVSIVVHGTLDAEGTETAPVRFLGSRCAGGWGGVAFLGANARGTWTSAILEGATQVAASGAVYPAAIALSGPARVSLAGCEIRDAAARAIDLSGGGELVLTDVLVDGAGDGLHSAASTVDVERCTLRGIAPSRSSLTAAVHLEGASPAPSLVKDCLVERCGQVGILLASAPARFEGNTIRDVACQGLAVRGSGSPVIERNLIHDSGIGLVVAEGAAPAISHATISFCDAGVQLCRTTAAGDGGHLDADSLIVWGNGASVVADGSSTLSVTFSDIEGGAEGIGNDDFNPLFVGAASGDFHLRPTSPARGAGLGGDDMGAYPGGEVEPGRFVRGDANRDGAIDIADAVRIALVLFAGRPTLCADALDVDDGGTLEVTDAIRLLGYLFKAGPGPAAPFPAAGLDPTTGDPLDCAG